MAWEKVEINTLVAASVGTGRRKNWVSSRQSQWDSLQQQTKKKRDPDAMDVDVVRTSRLSPKDQTKLLKEGKCFVCQKTGHMARACPEKPKGKGKGKAPETRARTTKIEEVVDDRDENEKVPTSPKQEDNPLEYGEEELIAAVRRMTTEKKEVFMEQLALEDF